MVLVTNQVDGQRLRLKVKKSRLLSLSPDLARRELSCCRPSYLDDGIALPTSSDLCSLFTKQSRPHGRGTRSETRVLRGFVRAARRRCTSLGAQLLLCAPPAQLAASRRVRPTHARNCARGPRPLKCLPSALMAAASPARPATWGQHLAGLPARLAARPSSPPLPGAVGRDISSAPVTGHRGDFVVVHVVVLPVPAL